jgi:plasmid stabilization system protein ParE
MPKPVEFLEGAREDFDESFDYYRARSAGAAIGFTAAVDEAIDHILANPGRFPFAYGGCRYVALHRYPFRIVFRDETARVVIVAVAHAKRRPDYWHGRT